MKRLPFLAVAALAFTHKLDPPFRPLISPENEKRNCACVEHLKETQMSGQVEHIEMEADLLGNHVNVRGIALMETTVDMDGRVLCVKALSGHPLAIIHLIGASPKWKFKPYLKNRRPQRPCGRLRLNFSFVENAPFVEVVATNPLS